MADLTLADVMALQGKDNEGAFGGGYAWIILIFLFFLAFGDGFGFGGRDGGVEEFTTQRDVLTTANNTQRDILTSACNTQKAVQDVNYQTLLGFKDQAMQLANCCCDIKNEVLAQNQLTRDLIQSQYIDGLRSTVVDLKADISNKNQNEFLLNTLGNYYMRPPVNPCTCYTNYGCGGGCNTGFNNFGGGCGCGCN